MNMTEEFWNYGSMIFEDGLAIFAIKSVLLLLAAKLAADMIRKVIKKVSIRKNRGNEIVFSYVNKTIRAVIYAITIFTILGGVKPLQKYGAALLGASSVLAVIVGLAAQETFGNYISGFFLAIYQPFKVGDIVTLPEKNLFGTVTAITFRHTVLNTMENTELIVPNSVMNSAILEDKPPTDREYTKYMEVTVGYDTDIDLMKEIIWDIAAVIPNVVDIRSEAEINAGVKRFPIFIQDFLDSGILVRFPVTTDTLRNNRFALSDFREEMLKRFRKAGIEIPYTKIDIVGLPDKS